MELGDVVIVHCIHCGAANELDEAAQAQGKFRCHQCGLIGDIDVFTAGGALYDDPRDDNETTAANHPIANRLSEERAGTITCGLIMLAALTLALLLLLT